MSGDGRRKLIDLIRLYVDPATEEVAGNEWRKIEAAGLDATRVPGAYTPFTPQLEGTATPDVQARRIK